MELKYQPIYKCVHKALCSWAAFKTKRTPKMVDRRRAPENVAAMLAPFTLFFNLHSSRQVAES